MRGTFFISSLFVFISLAANATDWLARLDGQWTGPFKDCVSGTGADIQTFDTGVNISWKLQGGGLRGLFDLGAHGWAFSSSLDQLPDSKHTMQLTLDQKDGAGNILLEHRLTAVPDDSDKLTFTTPAVDATEKVLVEFFVGNMPANSVGVIVKDTDVTHMTNLICNGQLTKAP